MGQINGKFRVGINIVIFFCPGCSEAHMIRVKGNNPWEFNWNYDRPTFRPSILVSGSEFPTDEEVKRIMAGEKVNLKKTICHSFVTDGKIQFLSDCTHHLVNQTVEIPELPDYLKD